MGGGAGGGKRPRLALGALRDDAWGVQAEACERALEEFSALKEEGTGRRHFSAINMVGAAVEFEKGGEGMT